MIIRKCKECNENKMIPVDTFSGWKTEELYFCTNCFHSKWLFKTDSSYEVVDEVDDYKLDDEQRLKLELLLSQEKKSEKKVMKYVLLILGIFAFIVLLFKIFG